jgi:hypothetical protein
VRDFSLLYGIRIGCGDHAAYYLLITRDSSEGVKRLGHEADNSPSSRAEFKDSWSYTYDHSYIFTAWSLVKHTGNFTFSIAYFFASLLCFVGLLYALYIGNYVYERRITGKVMCLLPVVTMETLEWCSVNYIRLLFTTSCLVLREST